MDFTQNRVGFSQEDDEMMMMSNKAGKHPFSYSSSSSPSSCSSYHQMSLGPMSSWLGSNSTHNNTTSGFEFMEATTASPDQSDDNNINNNNSNASASAVVGSCPPSFATIEKEHMFDKVVTPSDVGKLNRLVIPKQHAEKYFPLDASTNEKGLLLNFEDRNGKPWRFRYSYWNSSQSYVMTKGWSRFVKDKKLGAGDIVSFQRGVGEFGKDMLYIDWRRRPDVTPHQHHHHQPTSLPIFGIPQSHQYPIHRSIPWSPLLLRPPAPATTAAALPASHFNSVNNVHLYPYGRNSGSRYSGTSSTNLYSQGNNVLYMRPAFPALQWQQQQQGGGTGDVGAAEPMVFDSVPVVQGKAAAKRLRLFGVNMECPISDDQEDDEVLLSNTIQHATIASQAPQHSAYSNSSLQLRLYSGAPVQFNLQDKGKAPSSSLDLDM